MNYNKATLETIGGGEAVNKFNYELNKVIANCKDLNTEAKKVRKVILEVSLLPDEARENIAVKIQASSKIAPDAPCSDQLIVAPDATYVNNARQLMIEQAIDDSSENINAIGSETKK